jgi:hypothetical protein
VHLLYASIVGAAAWVLTSIGGASASTKYWIWVATALNFLVPTGAVIDKFWAPHSAWAAPLGAIRNLTEGRTPVALGVESPSDSERTKKLLDGWGDVL